MKTYMVVLLFCVFQIKVISQIHVSTSGNANSDGTSWQNPTTLQNAILQAPNNSEIWVKKGTYSISQRLNLTSSGIKLYGGFDGNETNLNQRDWENNLTIFDGQNAVQIMQFDSDNGVIDGIQFINGYVTGLVEENNTGGGAIRVTGDNQIIRNSTFLDNVSNSQRGGGAIFIWFGEGLLIDNCVFLQNHQTFEDSNGGGAIHNWDNNVTIKNSKFFKNTAIESGGAIYTWGNNLKIDNCEFKENESQHNGGAIYNWDHGFIVENCEFEANHSQNWGGAIRNHTNSIATINNSIFKFNTSSNGGAISNSHEITVTNSLFHGNEASEFGGAIRSYEKLAVTNSTFVENNNTAVIHQYNIEDEEYVNIYNSIFYSNEGAPERFADIDVNLRLNNFEFGNYRFNILQENNHGLSNLVGVNPRFEDIENFDFSLSLTSPAGNYGDNTLFTEVSTIPIQEALDLANNPRLYADKIDLGAFEVQEAMNLDDENTYNELKIHPNPAKNYFYVLGDLSAYEKLKIYSFTGEKLMDWKITPSHTNSFSIGHLPAGIYLVQLSNSKNITTKKLIKQ